MATITDTTTLKEGDEIIVIGERSNYKPITKQFTVVSIDHQVVEPDQYGIGGCEWITYTVRSKTGTEFTLSQFAHGPWAVYGGRGRQFITSASVEVR